MSANGMVDTPWYHLQTLGIDEGERKRGGWGGGGEESQGTRQGNKETEAAVSAGLGQCATKIPHCFMVTPITRVLTLVLKDECLSAGFPQSS